MRLLDNAKYIYTKAKEKCNLIIKIILQDITSFIITIVKDFNINTAFKLAFIAYLYLGKIIYTKIDLQIDFIVSKIT